MRPSHSIMTSPIREMSPLEHPKSGVDQSERAGCVSTGCLSPRPRTEQIFVPCISPISPSPFPLPLAPPALWPPLTPPAALPLVVSPTDPRLHRQPILHTPSAMLPPVTAVHVRHPLTATAWIHTDATAVRPTATVNFATSPSVHAPAYAFPAESYASQPYITGMERFVPVRRARDCTKPLKEWLVLHCHNPYPSKADKYYLVMNSGLTINQVSMWFANARRRIKKVGLKAWSKGIRGESEAFHSDPMEGDEDNDDVEFKRSERSEREVDVTDDEEKEEEEEEEEEMRIECPTSTSGQVEDMIRLASSTSDTGVDEYSSVASELVTEATVSSTERRPRRKVSSLANTSHTTGDTDHDTGYSGADSTSGEQEFSRQARHVLTPRVSTHLPLAASHRPPLISSASIEQSGPRQLFISSVLAASGSPLITWNVESSSANMPILQPPPEN